MNGGETWWEKNEKINVISKEEKTVDRRVRGGQRQLVGEGRTRTHTHARAAHNNNNRVKVVFDDQSQKRCTSPSAPAVNSQG